MGEFPNVNSILTCYAVVEGCVPTSGYYLYTTSESARKNKLN